MSKTPISVKNQNLLWAISGGRCEYEGCNTPLYMDILTKKKYNKAYIAHIVADSLDGPRGDPERSEKLANEISNLMLLCEPFYPLLRYFLLQILCIASGCLRILLFAFYLSSNFQKYNISQNLPLSVSAV